MRLLLLAAATAIIFACGKSNDSCGTYNGHTLYKGPNGGCYYINSSGNKTYVNNNNCNC
jgi:hypothetical protein